MKKHGRQQRQLRALTNFYRRHTSQWLGMLYAEMASRERAPRLMGSATRELHALESRLPPEMVAWAKLNR